MSRRSWYSKSNRFKHILREILLYIFKFNLFMSLVRCGSQIGAAYSRGTYIQVRKYNSSIIEFFNFIIIIFLSIGNIIYNAIYLKYLTHI